MKYSFGLAALAAAACVVADDITTVYVCDGDIVENVVEAAVVASVVATTTALQGGVFAQATSSPIASQTSVPSSVPATPLNPANQTAVYAPTTLPGLDTHDISLVVPQTNISLYYGCNTTAGSSISVNNTMKYPTVLLEQIASIVNVDCSANSVAMTFNNSDVFATTQSAWARNGTIVFITNHLGDCDPELERGFFLSTSLSFDNKTLVATASSTVANISSTAALTEITFGNLPMTEVTKRATVIDPTYTISTEIGLDPNTTLYSYAPYLTVTANEATFSGDVSFSGYLKFEWWGLKLKDLYFDIDVAFATALEITADVGASYNTTFTYSPDALTYTYQIPGILSIGPELVFAVDADIYASGETTITSKVDVTLADGNVHVDLLDESNTGTSGWAPTYSASASISAQVEAQLNPTASLSVGLELNFFSGLVDLSSGLIAKPAFMNDFILTGAAGVDLSGYEDLTNGTSCVDGLAIDSEFSFALDAYATKWYSANLYSVVVPIVKKCFAFAG